MLNKISLSALFPLLYLRKLLQYVCLLFVKAAEPAVILPGSRIRYILHCNKLTAPRRLTRKPALFQKYFHLTAIR